MQELFGRLQMAAYQLVHDFRDKLTRQCGAVALAPLVGMNPGTLSNKVNPQMPDHRLGLEESVPLQLIAGDFQLLHAYAAALGHCTYRLPTHIDASDMELLDLYCAVHEKGGLKARAIRDAIRDGRITRKELADMRALFDDEVRAGLEFFTRAEALAQ